MINLPQTLRSLRLKAGLTQAVLAESLGVSDRAVSRWENGQALPDITLLPKLAMTLHVSVDALLGVDGQRRQADIQAALAAGSNAMQNHQPCEAASMLRNALAVYPDEPELQAAPARALLAQKKIPLPMRPWPLAVPPMESQHGFPPCMAASR